MALWQAPSRWSVPLLVGARALSRILCPGAFPDHLQPSWILCQGGLPGTRLKRSMQLINGFTCDLPHCVKAILAHRACRQIEVVSITS